jgi:YggT family protein
MSPALAAITRHDVADYLATLLQIYIVLIFIRILMSWIPRMPYNQYLNAVLNFVRDVTDPYLNLFRRFLPMVRIGPGALDLSPIVATVVLIIVGRIIIGLVDGP